MPVKDTVKGAANAAVTRRRLGNQLVEVVDVLRAVFLVVCTVGGEGGEGGSSIEKGLEDKGGGKCYTKYGRGKEAQAGRHSIDNV